MVDAKRCGIFAFLLYATCFTEAWFAQEAAGAEHQKPVAANTGWRGPASGHYPTADPPTQWDDKKNIRWTVEVGQGRSSPITVGDRVFLTAEPSNLLCFKASTGELLWKRANGADELPADLRDADLEPPTECGYATPTPCSDGTHVFALFGNGVVACYDLEGRRNWIRLIEIEQTELHGRAVSPILVGDRLVVHVTDLFCLDTQTGETIWQQPSATAFGTPLSMRIGDTDVVITPKGDVFRESDGKRLASGIADVEVTGPTAHDGVVYFVGSVAKAIRLPQTIRDDESLTFDQLWQIELPGEFYASPIIHEGLIYAVNKEGRLVVLDAKTGATIHSRQLDIDSECAPSFCLADDCLFLYSEAGVTLVFRPGKECKQIQRNVVSRGSVATPTFFGECLLLRTPRDLVCIRAGSPPEVAVRPPQPDSSKMDVPSSVSSRVEAHGQPNVSTHADNRPASVLAAWRGNGAGLFPESTPPLEWGRKSKGLVASLKIRAAKPKGEGPGEPTSVRNNFPRQWLVIGPIPAPGGLDEPALPDEAEVGPDEGDQFGQLTWTRCNVPEDVMPPSDRGEVAGAVSLRFVEPEQILGGFKENHLVYAHTYLYSDRDGEAEIIVDHAVGLKVWINGREVYQRPTTEFRLSWYTVLSRFRTGSYTIEPSPRIRIGLRQGWNRVLFKLCHGRGNRSSFKFGPRVVDLPAAPYENKNIAWAAPLPDRSSSTPVIVGDRIFVMAEPDQLLCLDKATGRQLWTRFLGLYQATPEAVRNANPAFKENVEPLAAKLPAAKGLKQRLDLRKQIDEALVAIDPGAYELDWDDHMASHFRIIGWTEPTPCSDGKFVYVYCGNGVVACYDLDGNTRWIRRVNSGEIHYPASPALVDGKFIIFARGGFNLVALDAATGNVAWRQPEVDKCVGALIGAHIGGGGVVVSQKGDVVRVADGKLLYSNPLKRKGDTGWAPPLCLDDVMYLPWSGVGRLLVKDFSHASGDAWTCERRDIDSIAITRDKNGKWVDRWTCSSPLVLDGIYYNIDVFGTLYAVDLETRKVLYREDLSDDFNMLTHYNAVGVSASITLGGRHLFAMDNQGTTIVFEPGPTFKKVAINRIEQQLDRPWPIRPQEEIGYSPPLFEGSRMYLRGENYFYCIGAD